MRTVTITVRITAQTTEENQQVLETKEVKEELRFLCKKGITETIDKNSADLKNILIYLLESVKSKASLTISRKERIELLEQEIKDLKTLSPEPLKMKKFCKT